MNDIISEDQLESLRLKAKSRVTIMCMLSMFAFLLFSGLFYMALKGEEEIFWLFVVKVLVVSGVLALTVLGILWYVMVRSVYNEFNESFKSKYVLEVIGKSSGFTNLLYTHNGGFSWDDVRNFAVVNCGDKNCYECEDMVSGEYENVKFKICDVVTKRKVRRDKKTRIDEIFAGQILCLELDNGNRSNGYVQVFERQFLSNISGWKAEHSICTENEEFNKRFDVFASDEQNAHCILNNRCINKIMEFTDIIDCQVSMVFWENKLFVAVNRDSMFDALVDVPVYLQTQEIAKDVEFIKIVKRLFS